MKEDYMVNYSHDLETSIGFDSTDHFTIFCNKCNSSCEVVKCETLKKIVVDFEGTKDNCSYLWCICRKCKSFGKRKIYWKDYGGRCARFNFNYKNKYKEKEETD